MQIRAIKTRVFKENEDLIKFILDFIKKIPEKSILVITSKIVALSEGRFVSYASKRKLSKEYWVKKESGMVIKTGDTYFTIKDNMIMAAAGIDESNANGKLTLLPKDSYKNAEIIRQALQKKFKNKNKLKNFGVLIVDSGFLPLRSGAIGLALGYAGFKGIRNYIGQKDIFGRVLKVSRTDVADSLATAAVLCMGEGREQQPLILITEAPVEFTNKVNKKELRIDPKKDMFYPLMKNLRYAKKKQK